MAGLVNVAGILGLAEGGANGFKLNTKLEGMIPPNLGDVVENLVDILALDGGHIMARTGCAGRANATKCDLWQAAVGLWKAGKRHAAHAGDQDACGCVRIRLQEPEEAPVITKAELIDQLGIEEVGFAVHEVLAQVEVAGAMEAVADVVAAIDDGPERRSKAKLLVCIAEARVHLVCLADVPVNTLIPLEGVIFLGQIQAVVVRERAAARRGRTAGRTANRVEIGMRVRLKNLLGYGVRLAIA